MKTTFLCGILCFLFCAVSLQSAFSADSASARDVVEKVREAADYLKAKGNKAVGQFNNKSGKWVWKDTYVFVMDCNTMAVVAHPINPKLSGRNLVGMKDVKGNYFFIHFCDAAQKPKGGWVEYWWAKPGEETPTRKITYMLNVPGSNQNVGSGIYDDTIS